MHALSTKMDSLIDATIYNYNQAKIEAKKAEEYLNKASTSARAAGCNYYYTSQIHLIKPQEEKKLKEYVWRSIIEKTGIITLMDSETRKKMNRDLETQPLELTKPNILSVLQDLYGRKDTILANSLINVFKKLIRSYKSNNANAIHLTGKRIIIYCGQGVYRSSDHTDRITDLDRILHFLDGETMTTKRNETLGYKACYGNVDEIENDYLRVKLFKNGNGHIYFKRPDLIDQCNRLIAYHHKNQLGKV